METHSGDSSAKAASKSRSEPSNDSKVQNILQVEKFEPDKQS